MKLWDKGYSLDKRIERFTVGKDRELDLLIAPYDIMGTLAHVKMLGQVGLIPSDEVERILPELRKLFRKAAEGDFVIEEGVEDVHSQVELELTRALGETGKKVHTGRSRNDQVLVDLKLYARARLEQTVGKAERLFKTLQRRSEENKDVLMPGYTHLQVAMPSSFGLWFGAYAESLTDDMVLLKAAWDIVDRNPLGSAAGYGSSAPLDRVATTRFLGFADLDYNAVYAQMGRGRMERQVAFAYASLAETVGKLAADCCLFNSQNFGFVTLPDNLTTGSSIMPHKKNPDVFELLRASCNRLQGLPGTIRFITGNLPSGYFRDLQLLKEEFLPLFDRMDDILDIADYAVSAMRVREGLMDDPRYALSFSVEEVNRRAAAGVPFRDAYRQVADEIAAGTFRFEGTLHHTHAGSIGNLCNDAVAARMDALVTSFPFGEVHAALDALTCEN